MKRIKPKIIFAIVGLTTGLLNTISIAQACSVCITGASDPTADAFNWSVFFLMAAPYSVVASIAGWLFYTHRRSTAKRAQSEAAPALVHLSLNPEENGR